jgi:hypothetical protein
MPSTVGCSDGCDIGHLLVQRGAEDPLPTEEQRENEPTKENDPEDRNDANAIGFGPTEAEQSAMYSEQKNERDNDVGSDDHEGNKPKPRPQCSVLR